MRCFGLVLALVLAFAPEALAARKGSPGFGEQVEAMGLAPEEVIDPFAASPEMVAFAQEAVRGAYSAVEKLDALQRALFESRHFDFEYDRDATLTAEEAFVARRGNCLAFTALFISLARSVNVPAYLVSVHHDTDVAQEDDLIVLTRHVVAGYSQVGTTWLYDFSEKTNEPGIAFRPVDDLTAASMFHANLGARALRDGRPAEASRLLEVAATLAPERTATWVNLGVARRRSGDMEGAIEAYQRVIDADPHNGSAWTNLAVVYQASGRSEEAEAALQAAARDTTSPYHLVALADLLRGTRRLDEAERLLKRARRSHPGTPEVREGLARWAMDADEPTRARRYARQAERLRRQATRQGDLDLSGATIASE